jgi:hypothetical protein
MKVENRKQLKLYLGNICDQKKLAISFFSKFL